MEITGRIIINTLGIPLTMVLQNECSALDVRRSEILPKSNIGTVRLCKSLNSLSLYFYCENKKVELANL